MNRPIIEIKYRIFVPEEIIEDFYNEVNPHIEVRPVLIRERPKAHVEHFEAAAIEAIKIFFDNHAGGITDGLISGGIILAIQVAFIKLQKVKSAPDKLVMFEYVEKDFKAKFTIEGSSTEKEIEKCFNGLTQIIDRKNLKRDYDNPGYHKYKNDFVDYRYDKKSGLWFPFNYEAEKRRRKDWGM